jgi:hypothetical protein
MYQLVERNFGEPPGSGILLPGSELAAEFDTPFLAC